MPCVLPGCLRWAAPRPPLCHAVRRASDKQVWNEGEDQHRQNGAHEMKIAKGYGLIDDVKDEGHDHDFADGFQPGPQQRTTPVHSRENAPEICWLAFARVADAVANANKDRDGGLKQETHVQRAIKAVNQSAVPVRGLVKHLAPTLAQTHRMSGPGFASRHQESDFARICPGAYPGKSSGKCEWLRQRRAGRSRTKPPRSQCEQYQRQARTRVLAAATSRTGATQLCGCRRYCAVVQSRAPSRTSRRHRSQSKARFASRDLAWVTRRLSCGAQTKLTEVRGQNRRRRVPAHHPDAHPNHEEVIQLPDDGDKAGDDLNRAEHVADAQRGGGPGSPGNASITDHPKEQEELAKQLPDLSPWVIRGFPDALKSAPKNAFAKRPAFYDFLWPSKAQQMPAVLDNAAQNDHLRPEPRSAFAQGSARERGRETVTFGSCNCRQAR